MGSEGERPVRSSLRQGLGWVGVTMFVVAVFALVSVAQRGNPTERQVRQRLLQELQPVTLQNCTLERFGSPNDGGYLMCGNLLGNIQSAYSYGIGPADDWGCAISQRYDVVVHQYDCFSPPDAACSERAVGVPRRVHRPQERGQSTRGSSTRCRVRSSGTATPARRSSSKLMSREPNSRSLLVDVGRRARQDRPARHRDSRHRRTVSQSSCGS